ncbi:MAG TPA: N-6 DNA methylase [Bacteroidales bacterium]|jgi:16S rRNA G966 N2-methylase RsmD|nr:N-6 DNA methylase [Bacteroidales bacterium]
MEKKDIQDTLGISMATIQNWIKTSIIPSPDCGDKYSEKVFNDIIEKIRKNPIKLNSRANRSQIDKKYITYLGIKDKSRRCLLKQIIERFESSNLSIHEGVIALSISFLKSNNLFVEGSIIYNKIIIWIKEINSNLDKLLIFSNFKLVNMDDDFIGAFYQSIQSIAVKSTAGSYYTSYMQLSEIKLDNTKTVIDPCCGSGSILLKVISKNHDPKLVYARDIDKIALQICTVNLVMFFNNPNIEANISYQDLLFKNKNNTFFDHENEKFDYIITNPPWGSKFSKKQKDLLRSYYPNLLSTESFSIALYQSIQMLSDKSVLYFFLPYSFLNVSTHRNIRKYILESPLQIEIKLLGNIFKGVLSEVILLILKKDSYNYNNKIIKIKRNDGTQYFLNRDNIIGPDYIITATSSNKDDAIISKIFSSEYFTLLDNTDFAIGIVTGNNKKYILKNKTDDSEPIYRGMDILPYTYSVPKCFIKFKPEVYQQVAPLKLFRTKKIVYRFISNKLICVLDDTNSLILNSANLFISHDYPMETIVCLFNSNIYTFIYRKMFHSTKVLKSHIQNMPLPKYSEEEHTQFRDFYNDIRSGTIKQEIIDSKICRYFNISREDYLYIKETVNESSY